MPGAVRAFASLTLAAAVLGGCGSPPTRAPERPEDIRARIASLLPASVPDRAGWALDITAAFAALGIDPTNEHACAVLAIVEQESTYRADPTVPGLGRIARDEIDRRADRAGVPKLLVQAALGLRSPDGRTWAERIDAARTEKELSDLFEDFIAQVPLGQRLLAGFNPVRTGGPMQVSIAFAEKQQQTRPYPYRMTGSLRDEVFTRRGGVYFGVAHLLGYPANYDRMIYRFADYNAGFYASRNAAFQSALAIASGRTLALDGDLIAYDDDKPGATELAVRSLSREIAATDSEIRRALDSGESADFEQTDVYQRIFTRAQKIAHRKLPRAMLPEIALKSPKITRKLTTEWFARRVDQRYAECLAKAGAGAR